MRIAASMLMVAAAFGGASRLMSMPVELAAPIVVGAAVAMAIVAAGRPSPLAVAVGSAGAAAFVLLWPVWPALAGAVLVVSAHGARLTHARDWPGAVVIAALAALAGAAGSWLVTSFVGERTALAAVAVGMAALLAGAPWLIAVDDPIAYGLRWSARRASGEVRWTLLRAIVLRRHLDDVAHQLSRKERARLERAWRTLERLASARRHSPRAARRTLDARITAHVQAFQRVWRAGTARRALSDGFGLDALDELRIDGDELEAEAAALAEAKGDDDMEIPAPRA